MDRFNFTWIGAVLLCLTAAWLLARYRVADPDLFARVAVGKIIAITGRVATVDPFAFTERKPIWIDHEWLSGLVFYWTLRLGSDPALLALKLALAFTGITLLWHAHRLAGGGSFTLLLLAVFQAIPSWQSPLRSQAFTYVLLPLYLLAFLRLERLGKPRLLLIAAPLLMPFWANAHGGFVVGLIFHGIFAASLWWRRSSHAFAVTIAWVLSICGTFLNPFGPIEYWKYILHAVSMPRPNIAEWEALNPFSSLAIIPDIFAVLVITGLWALWRRERTWLIFTRFDVILVIVSLVQAYRHLRFIPIFTMVAVIYGTELIVSSASVLPDEAVVLARKMARAVIIVLLLSIPYQLWETGGILLGSKSFEFFYGTYPQRALEWLNAHRSGGNVLAPFTEGSYALYRLYPRFKVAIDGRYEEIYTDRTSNLTMDAFEPLSKTRNESVKAINPDFILIRTEVLEKQPYAPEWHPIYKDKMWAILAKEAGATTATLPLEYVRHDWNWESASWRDALLSH